VRSPLVYRDCGGWLDRARGLADELYSPRELGAAWCHGAAANFAKYVTAPQRRGDGVLRKKYLHVFRPMLAARWLTHHGRGPATPAAPLAAGAPCWPPLLLTELLHQSVHLPEGARAAALALLEPAAVRAELRSVGPPCAALDAAIAAMLQARPSPAFPAPTSLGEPALALRVWQEERAEGGWLHRGTAERKDAAHLAASTAAWDDFCVALVSSLSDRST
jgi:predicted nucleotidyltransferase